MLPYNMAAMDAQINAIDAGTVYQLIQNAAAEAGIEANALWSKMEMYMRQYGVNPYQAYSYSLQDMNLLSAYGQASAGSPIAGAAAAGLFAYGNYAADLNKD